MDYRNLLVTSAPKESRRRALYKAFYPRSISNFPSPAGFLSFLSEDIFLNIIAGVLFGLGHYFGLGIAMRLLNVSD